jgi:hypothetical protein
MGTFQLIKQGNLRVEIYFAEALAGTINVVLYAEFDDVIEIDRGNRIYFDFYTSDGVFTAGLFQSFDVTHSYGRT